MWLEEMMLESDDRLRGRKIELEVRCQEKIVESLRTS